MSIAANVVSAFLAMQRAQRETYLKKKNTDRAEERLM
jgi:hypothetical protein